MLGKLSSHNLQRSLLKLSAILKITLIQQNNFIGGHYDGKHSDKCKGTDYSHNYFQEQGTRKILQ